MIRFRYWARTAAIVITAACVISGCTPNEYQSYDSTLAIIDARSTLYQDADNSDQTFRCNAIEALAEVEGVKAGGVFMQALDDPKPMVRFAAAMAIGDIKYAPALNKLLDMADPAKRIEPDKRVFCAVIYALHQLGNDDYAGELGNLLTDDQPEVKADAAMAMGKMKEPSAIGPLNTQLTDGQQENVKLVIIEAMAMLGDEKSSILLETYIKKHVLEDQLVAIGAMARAPSQRSMYVLYNVMTRIKEEVIVRCAAAGAVGRLGHAEDYGYQLCVNALLHPYEIMKEKDGDRRTITELDITRLKQVAAMSLGDMGRNSAVGVLLPVLKSTDSAAVRIAAARSILKLLSTPEPQKTAPPENIEKPEEKPQTPEAPEEGKEPPVEERPKLHSSGAKD